MVGTHHRERQVVLPVHDVAQLMQPPIHACSRTI